MKGRVKCCDVGRYVFPRKNISLNNSQYIAIYQVFFDNNTINILFWKINFSVEFQCTLTTDFMAHDQVAVQICMSFTQDQNLFVS